MSNYYQTFKAAADTRYYFDLKDSDGDVQLVVVDQHGNQQAVIATLATGTGMLHLAGKIPAAVASALNLCLDQRNAIRTT